MIPLLGRFDEIYGGQMTAPWRAMYETRGTKDNNDPCQIEEGLYLGSCRAANNKEVLKSLNVTHVLTVASSLPPSHPNDFEYKIVDVRDQPGVNISQYFDDCFGFVDEAKGTGGGVLVHCVAGKSRSVTIVLAYLMKKRSMKLCEAFHYVKSKRPVASPNNGFLLQLQNFEKVLGGMDYNLQAQAENKKDQGYFTRIREMQQFLSSRFKDQINLGTLEETVKPKEERDLDVAPTSRVPNQQLKCNAEIIGETFKLKVERKLEYDASHTYRVPNLLGKSPALGTSLSFMAKKRDYSIMQQSSHCMTNIHANIQRAQAGITQMAKRRNYIMQQSLAGLANFLKYEPPRATTQMALDEVSKVEGLSDTQILRAVDLLMTDQRKFETFSGLPNRLRRTWLSMHLGDQF